jgi:hypothetical protein
MVSGLWLRALFSLLTSADVMVGGRRWHGLL